MNNTAVVMIVCKKRYARVAAISVPSFLKYHSEQKLIVVVDSWGMRALEGVKAKNLQLVRVGPYKNKASEILKVNEFSSFDYYGLAHDRAFSSMKPVIMECVVAEHQPNKKYILGIDADSIFTGNILELFKKSVAKLKKKYDMYMVSRKDKRIWSSKDNTPGSGFVLWKRSGAFLPRFIHGFTQSCGGRKGGSQDLTNSIRLSIKSKLLNVPNLHFVGPDLKNPKITDKQILSLRPAYIHLHGPDPYKRLLRFKKVFDDASKKH